MSIQIVKKIIQKALITIKDIYVAQLNYKNSYIDSDSTLSQLLISRNIRSRIRKHYNRRVKQLSEIPINTKVYVQLQSKTNWTPGTIRNRVYKVILENGEYNKKFLKSIKESIIEERVNHHSPSDFKKENPKIENVKYYIEISKRTKRIVEKDWKYFKKIRFKYQF